MQMTADLLPGPMVWALTVAALAVLAGSLATGKIDRFVRRPGEFHMLAACSVAMMVLWSIRADVAGSPGIHVIGVTTVTLLLGPARALLATIVAQATTSWIAGDPSGILPGWLLGSVVPVATTELARTLVWRWLPRDPFAFIFGAGFFGAGLAIAAVYGTVALILGGLSGIWSGSASWPGLLLLIAFPEAFINGCLVTMLVVFCPEHLAGYRDGYEVRPRL